MARLGVCSPPAFSIGSVRLVLNTGRVMVHRIHAEPVLISVISIAPCCLDELFKLQFYLRSELPSFFT